VSTPDTKYATSSLTAHALSANRSTRNRREILPPLVSDRLTPNERLGKPRRLRRGGCHKLLSSLSSGTTDDLLDSISLLPWLSKGRVFGRYSAAWRSGAWESSPGVTNHV